MEGYTHICRECAVALWRSLIGASICRAEEEFVTLMANRGLVVRGCVVRGIGFESDERVDGTVQPSDDASYKRHLSSKDATDSETATIRTTLLPDQQFLNMIIRERRLPTQKDMTEIDNVRQKNRRWRL